MDGMKLKTIKRIKYHLTTLSDTSLTQLIVAIVNEINTRKKDRPHVFSCSSQAEIMSSNRFRRGTRKPLKASVVLKLPDVEETG